MELDPIFYIHTGKFISNSNTNHLSDFESHKKIIMKEIHVISSIQNVFILFLSLLSVKVLTIMDKTNHISHSS